MKKRNSYNHSFTLRTACRAIACCAAWMAASCTNNGFDETIPDLDSSFAFGVSVPEAWTEGTDERAERTAGLYVDEMTRSDGAEPLYLVTEISEQDDTTAEKPVTRGAQIGKIEDFHASFGLSGVCRAAGTDANDMTTNVAHDLKMTRASDKSPWAAADGTVIHRPGSGTVTFYAYAPHSSDESLKGALKHAADKPSITYTVPDDPEEQLDIMTATADCDAASSGDVNLAFGHALTAVTIKTGDAMLGGKITEVKISGVYGSGTHTIGSGKWTASGDPRTFTITKEIALPDTSDDNSYAKPDTPIVGDKLTLMMIPQTLPDGAALTIKFRDNLSQSDRTLTASLKGKTWPAGRKVTYSISSTGVVIAPEVALTTTRTDVNPSGCIFDVKLAAYARVAQVGQKDAPIVALPYTVEYATSTDGATWSKWTEGEWIPDTAPAADADPKDQVSGHLMLQPQSSFEKLREPFVKKGLLTDKGIGSATAPQDLSEGGETANCYVIHDHGYYSLPTIYGNARGAGEQAYTYQGTVPDATKAYVLTKFVNHDNKWITKPEIDGIADAVLVWQDAPELVTDVKYENDMVRFHVAKQTFTQGNAVIAVRDAAKTILWSWHIWVTPYKWDGTEDQRATTPAGVPGGTTYDFAPCNLGFCEPHGADPERTFKLRFSFTLPDGKSTKKTVEYKDTFTQPEIIESAAGDNTYYQWGRKDPMLGGVFNSETLEEGRKLPSYALQSQYNMRNKVHYPSDPAYEFKPAECGVSIGEAIRQPYLFFMHSYDDTTVSEDEKNNHNYLRRHWHDGSKTSDPTGNPGQKTIMNYWNSQLDEISDPNKFDAPNGNKVVKTIYDPCPVGYNVPTPNAFAQFGNAGVYDLNETNANGLEDVFNDNGIRIGWKLSLQAGGGEPKIFFPATGLRDMGSAKEPTIPDYLRGTTWPAHADLTFVVTTAFTTNSAGGSTLLFYLDRRNHNNNKGEQEYNHIAINNGTNNAYGFSVRPVRESK